MEKLIDLSQEIKDDMPLYPGDMKTSLIWTNHFNVDGYNNHRLEISMHSGTHIDSPMHLTESSIYISELALESFIAPGCVLDVREQQVIGMKPEYEMLIKEESIVLLYTGQDKIYGSDEYYEKHPLVTLDFCKFLVKKNVKMLGMDMPSPDRYPFEIHKYLLQNNIYILENLTNLDKLLDLKRFEIIAFPLKIKADGAMVRAVAREIS